MTTFTVTAFVNIGADNFSGYQPTHPIAEVGAFTVEATDARAAAEAMFAVGNRMATDAHAQSWPSDVRSLSVGDLLAIRGTSERSMSHLAVASFGWTDVPEPANRVVALAGTDATSRVAGE